MEIHSNWIDCGDDDMKQLSILRDSLSKSSKFSAGMSLTNLSLTPDATRQMIMKFNFFMCCCCLLLYCESQLITFASYLFFRLLTSPAGGGNEMSDSESQLLRRKKVSHFSAARQGWRERTGLFNYQPWHGNDLHKTQLKSFSFSILAWKLCCGKFSERQSPQLSNSQWQVVQEWVN